MIFRNTRYEVQRAVKNAAYLNGLELSHWRFAYCRKGEANADLDTFSPAPYGNFLHSCYKCSFPTGSETENKYHTVMSACKNPEALDGVPMGGNNGF